MPGKLAGEPHVMDTRVQTQALAALAHSGFSTAQIGEMYPFIGRLAVTEAIDLEQQLAGDLLHAA